MTNLVIRDVDPQGADALSLLNEASVDARALYPELFVGATKSAINDPLSERDVYVVGYVDGCPLACGAVRQLSLTDAELRRIYVHREHRRQGLARAVLLHLVGEARRLGYIRLVLETGSKQLPAMVLYESMEFKRIPPFGEYANDPTSVCYERLLDVDA